MEILKKCPKCKIEYPATLEYFFAEKRGRYGLRSKCKMCFQTEAKKLKAKPEYRAKAIEHGRKYYQKNKEKFSQRWSLYYQKNSARLIEKVKEWAINNPEKRRAVGAKRRSNTQYRLSLNISRSIRQSLKNNGTKSNCHWETLVGFTLNDVKKHLEKQFKPGMSWDNYGEWHIDHKIPVSVFNFTKPEHDDFKRCWSLSNLQPLWAKENLSKNAKLFNPFQPKLAIG